MYQVTVHHHDKDWVRGDLEDKFVLIIQEVFKTRTAAKEFMEEDVSRRHCNVIYRDYHKGDEPSYIFAYTGVEWQHENSGETMKEYYQYRLTKIKWK